MTGPSPAARHGEEERACTECGGRVEPSYAADGCPLCLRCLNTQRPDLVRGSAAHRCPFGQECPPASSAALDGDNDGDVLDELVQIALDWAWEPGIQPTDEQVQILRDTLAGPLRRLTAERDEARAANERVEKLCADEDTFCEAQDHAEIRVAVPMKAGREFLDHIFEVIGDAAVDAEPEDRDWDVFVSASMPETPQVPVHLLRRALDGGA